MTRILILQLSRCFSLNGLTVFVNAKQELFDKVNKSTNIINTAQNVDLPHEEQKQKVDANNRKTWHLNMQAQDCLFSIHVSLLMAGFPIFTYVYPHIAKLHLWQPWLMRPWEEQMVKRISIPPGQIFRYFCSPPIVNTSMMIYIGSNNLCHYWSLFA